MRPGTPSLVRARRLESVGEIHLVGRGVVDHEVDRFDDAPVLLEVAVDQFRSARIFPEQAAPALPNSIRSRAKCRYCPIRSLGFLILSDQIGFVIRQKVAAAPEKVLSREREAQQKRGNQYNSAESISCSPR